jgi:hypothetical protein
MKVHFCSSVLSGLFQVAALSFSKSITHSKRYDNLSYSFHVKMISCGWFISSSIITGCAGVHPFKVRQAKLKRKI